MNIHHLELFYYVARFGGIAEAVRNMPYGIQQPAVSAQVIQLEEVLELTLFHRRPFSLTPAGEKLYKFIEPFFSQLEKVADELRGGMASQIRIGASEIFLREHLPEIVQEVRKRHPKLKLFLREDYQPQLLDLLQKQEIDLAVTVIDGRLPAGIQSCTLIEAPLVLLVEKGSKIQSADDLWKRDKIEETLICSPPNEITSRNLQQGLRKKEIDWFPGIEVSTLTLIETYVANGYGIGIGVAIPRRKTDPKIREIPLPDFPPVILGALWTGKASSLVDVFLNAIKQRARSIST